MTSFPTREGPINHPVDDMTNRGNPKRAVACWCERPLVHEGECVRCGRFTEETIMLSWLEADLAA